MSPPRKPRFIRFNTTQQALFARRLALYLRSGIPITQALSFMSEDAASRSSRYLFGVLLQVIETGQRLSSALAQFPKQFDSFAIGFVSVGETSGNLSETLERLALSLNKRDQLRRKILSALAYPAIVFCGTIGMTLFLTLYIFPKIIPILSGFGSKLPFTTRVLIGLNELFRDHFLVLITLCLVALVCMVLGLRNTNVRRILESILLRIPILAPLLQYYAVAMFSRMLSLQLRSGVRILPALTLTQHALPGLLYAEGLEDIESHLAQGQRLSAATRAHERLFPALVSQMIAAGEVTGTLGANLETLADLYEEHLDELTRNLSVLIEPVLMMSMGFVVGFVALAIITPIYGITQNLTLH